MLPPKQNLDPVQQELLALYRQLDERQSQSLLDFARFLAQQNAESTPGEETVETQPLGIPRPEQETVVAAIRRLSQNYPMLNRDTLLHETSSLMTAHVMHGRSAFEVIDQLEALFEGAYKNHSGEED